MRIETIQPVDLHLLWSREPSSFLSPCMDLLHFSCKQPVLEFQRKTRNSDGLPILRKSLSLCLSPFCRHSGMDWQGTLFLTRQMAWGETLIWTSSASKRTALPGWAQRPGTANYNALMLLSHWLICSIRACVCLYERQSESESWLVI